MLEKLDIRDTAEGELNADIKLDARGASVAELMAALNGTIIVMGEGRIKNKYIDLLGANISAGIFRLINPLKGETQFTEINCLVSRFDISNGVARSVVLVADTSVMTVFGEGEINLKTEELDMGLKPAPKKGMTSLPDISLGIGELMKPFRLSGTLAEPKLALDPKLSPISIGASVLGSAGSRSEGILTGLFGSKAGKDPCSAAMAAAESGTPISTPKKSAPAEKVDAAAEQEEPAQQQRPRRPRRMLRKLLGN
jgi:uncharacterized protein involved in outer membrane biogenesis